MKGLQECLDTLKEVIISQQVEGGLHEPTPSEYFAIVTATLSTHIDEDKLPLLLKIFIGVIPNTSMILLRGQFRPIILALMNIMKLLSNGRPNETLQVLTLTAIGKVLLAQETSQGVWDSVQALQGFNTLLTFLDAESLRTRRAASSAIIDLLAYHHAQHFLSLRTYFGEFCQGIVKACSRSFYRRTHCLIILLDSAFVHLPDQAVKKFTESCLKIQACEIPRLTAAVYRMLDSTFQHPSFDFSAAASTALLTVLLHHKPTNQDVESNCYYFTSLGSCLIGLSKKDSKSAMQLLGRVLDALVLGCEAEYTQVHIASCGTMKRIIQHFITAKALAAVVLSPANTADKATVLHLSKGKTTPDLQMFVDMAATLEKLLQFRYQLSWTCALDVLKAYFMVFRGYQHKLFFIHSFVTKIGEVIQGIVSGGLNIDASIHTTLLDTLSVALHTCGLAAFLQFIPVIDNVIIKSELVNQLKSREWIIDLLQSELKHMPCKLADFVTALLPIASKFHKLVADESNALGLTEVQLKIVRNRVIQIWALFPEICVNKPIDMMASFPKMNTIITQAIEDADYPEVAFSMMVALGRIVEAVDGFPQDKAMLGEQAVLYLPLLLKYSETLQYGDGKFKEALHAIALWVTVAPAALVNQVCTKLLKLVLTNTHIGHASNLGVTDSLDTAAVWMATMLAIIPSLPGSMIEMVYKTVRPLLSVEESLSLQKSCYSLLHAIISHHITVLLQHEQPLELLRLVCDSLLTAHVSTRNMRLKCISSLLEHMDASQLEQAVEMVLSEVLVCQKDANKKCRDGAVSVLKVFANQLPPVYMFRKLCTALSAESTNLCASALNALSLLMLEQNKAFLGRQKRGRGVKKTAKVTGKRSRSDEESVEDQDSEEEDGDSDEDMDMEEEATEYDELQSMATGLLPSVSLLLSQQSTEQTKASMGYLKVLASVLQEPHLSQSAQHIITSACTEVGSQKDKFATRVRAIMRKYFRKLGDEKLRAMLPEADVPLLDYIARQQRKDWKRKQAKQAEAARTDYERMLGSDSDDDSDDEEEVKEVEDERLSGKRMKAQRAQGAGFASLLPSVLDSLLQGQDLAQGMSRIDLRHAPSKEPAKAQHNRHKDNRAAVDEVDGVEVKDDEDEAFQITVGADGKVVIKQTEKKKADDTAAAAPATAIPATGAAVNQRPAKKRKTLSLKDPGAEYRAKKAGGDVWKKGVAVQPHAYIPLDPRLLSKKHHKQAVEHFSVVVDSNKQNRMFGGRKKVAVPKKK